MANVVLNLKLAEEVAAGEEVRKVERERAEKAADFARGISPVLTGRYRDSIHVEETPEGFAVVADATNDSGEGYAAYVEVGTFDTPAHHTLAKAAEALKEL